MNSLRHEPNRDKPVSTPQLPGHLAIGVYGGKGSIQDLCLTHKTRFIHRAALIWALLAFAAVIVSYVRRLHMSLDGDYHGWGSACFLTIARAFNELGALHSRFVPIPNNLPVGSDPDVYLHWPPLFSLVLALFLKAFGDAPAAGRVLELIIVILTAAIVMMITHRLFSPTVALLFGFFYLTSRATYQGASAIEPQALAMLFASASVLFFLFAVEPEENAAPRSPSTSRGPTQLPYALIGVICVILTVLTAWDPIFIPFGLLACSVYLRCRAGIRLAFSYISAAVVTFVAIQTDYLLSYPALFKNQFATIAYRAGLNFNGDSSAHLHTFIDQTDYGTQLSLFSAFTKIWQNIFSFLGPFALVASCIVFAIWFKNMRLRERHPDRSIVLLLFGFGLPWIAWYVVMRNYVAIHSYVLVMATPFVAIASAIVLDAIWNFLSASPREKPVLWLMATIFPALLISPLIVNIAFAHQSFEPPKFSDLSPLIEHNTPPNAVVLSPIQSLVPTYYSRRHIVRGIQSDLSLQLSIVEAHAGFQGSPLFLAMLDSDKKCFPATLPHLKVVAEQGDAVVYELADRNAP